MPITCYLIGAIAFLAKIVIDMCCRKPLGDARPNPFIRAIGFLNRTYEAERQDTLTYGRLHVATRAGERCAAGVVNFGFAEADNEQ